MSQPPGFDFTQFVPGFDFLKNLTPGGTGAASSALPGWVAPSLDPQELEKRIQELKTVQFWLEQNTKAIAATIQALEVQHMTLNTLKSMNMRFNDVAESLKAKVAEGTQAAQGAKQGEGAEAAAAASTAAGAELAAGVNPAQWWGALTEQFQHIATHTMKDMAQRAAAHAATESAPTAVKKAAAKTTTKAKVTTKPKAVVRKTPARQAPTSKTATGKTATSPKR